MIQDLQRRAAPVAVLVDGDNLSHDHADRILEEAKRLGPVTLRRVYGNMILRRDWDGDPRFNPVHAHGGKNNADIRLVIDAMEIALSGWPHSFVIASGDGDFAPLATWLREAGDLVLGIGGVRASLAFQAACSDFRHLVSDAVPPPEPNPPMPVLTVIDDAILSIMRNDGDYLHRVTVQKLGTRLHQSPAKLKVKDSGCSSWRKYLEKKCDLFKIEGPQATATVRPSPILAAIP